MKNPFNHKINTRLHWFCVNLVVKEFNYKYLGDFKLVEKFDIESNKVVNFEPIHEVEIKECNLELGNIEEKNMKLKGSREMKKNEKITLEELLNGYKYE